jgi:DAK2 domain fusion protein YloV
MKTVVSCSGREFKDMFSAGSVWLEKSVADVNAINVFPVPDGDTGTNMHLTIRSTLEEAERALNESVAEISKAMAQGALMGARGNSGVILSQFFRGLAKGLEKNESVNADIWAKALMEGSHTAYKGLSQPAEGTMLTVMRDAATAAQNAAQNTPDDFKAVMEASVEAAKESVARTPLLLPVLRDAGVADAGGQGFFVLLEGALLYLKGELEGMKYSKPEIVAASGIESSSVPQISMEKEEPYGYCTNFLLVGQKLNPDKIRDRLEGKGQSLVVAGDANNVRVHIHTYDPGAILRFATSLGTLHHIQIQNMDDQHEGFLEMQQPKEPSMDIAIVTVAPGKGMTEVFKSLGAASIVPGGQTMNPSVKEILAEVDAVPSKKVIILPNNKNIVLSASQVKPLSSKEVAIIPTKTIPQGIAALLAFNYEGSLDENVKSMEEALSLVKTVEITKSVRSTRLNNLEIKEGNYIGIIDDKDIVASGDDIFEIVFKTLDSANMGSSEVITIYYGEDVSSEDADNMLSSIRSKYPEKQIEMVSGGQPHYYYIISIE